jgi:hypothetical protein
MPEKRKIFCLLIKFFFSTLPASFQLGIAVGFLLPPILVKNHAELDLIGNDLQFMFYSVAGFTTILVILVVLCKHINACLEFDTID